MSDGVAYQTGSGPPLTPVTPAKPLPTGQGFSSVLNITAATVVKPSAGRCVKIVVVVAGSAAGAAYDCATTGAAAASNEIAPIPATVGPIALDWPCATGIVVVPGTGQTLAVSYA